MEQLKEIGLDFFKYCVERSDWIDWTEDGIMDFVTLYCTQPPIWEDYKQFKGLNVSMTVEDDLKLFVSITETINQLIVDEDDYLPLYDAFNDLWCCDKYLLSIYYELMGYNSTVIYADLYDVVNMATDTRPSSPYSFLSVEE